MLQLSSADSSHAVNRIFLSPSSITWPECGHLSAFKHTSIRTYTLNLLCMKQTVLRNERRMIFFPSFLLRHLNTERIHFSSSAGRSQALCVLLHVTNHCTTFVSPRLSELSRDVPNLPPHPPPEYSLTYVCLCFSQITWCLTFTLRSCREQEQQITPICCCKYTVCAPC